MDFSAYLKLQIEKHPSMQPQDIVKLCYQASFGAEHLLTDPDAARNYFLQEFQSVSAENVPLYEDISEEICCISLPAWKYAGMPAEWLFQIFLASAKMPFHGTDTFLQYLNSAEKVLSDTLVSFSFAEWQTYLTQYKKEGIHAVHHSPAYRQEYHPSYRIIHKKFLRLLPVLQAVEKRSDNDSVKIIAIDGRSASGKTTLADDLKEILQADVIHMDDFFLPPALRTESRLAEPGGNIHYERFSAEVLPFLKNADPFSYRIFDCSKMDYSGSRCVSSAKWRIVEGCYGCHPLFGDFTDVKIFSDISPKDQMERILKRNGKQMSEVFRTRWIPMEEKYYAQFQIKEQADIIL